MEPGSANRGCLAGQNIETFLDWLQLSDPTEIETFLTDKPRVIEVLDRIRAARANAPKPKRHRKVKTTTV